jgi:EAL domain-containing protein (putative c-di-GMP-specific phosphodiesterase class I)
VLRLADVALYEAKGAGKACHRTFAPSMHAAILRRLEIEADLAHAIEDPVASGFSLEYQPIVGLATGELVGVETLVRWRHPARGLLPPSVFIPLAEASQTILPLGAWIMAEACRQLANWQHRWRMQGVPRDRWPSVTLNVSGRQLMDPGFPDLFERILVATGASPHGLILELTETVLLEHSDAVAGTLGRLKALAVRFAVDDFGTGYSSLSYLRRFPVDILKIDRSFVEALAEDANDALVRAIVALGESMQLSTIAEGIETPTQRDALAAMGCHAGQGFLFAAPLSAEALQPWLECGPGGALPLSHMQAAGRAA